MYPLSSLVRWTVVHDRLALQFVDAAVPDLFVTPEAQIVSEILSTYIHHTVVARVGRHGRYARALFGSGSCKRKPLQWRSA